MLILLTLACMHPLFLTFNTSTRTITFGWINTHARAHKNRTEFMGFKNRCASGGHLSKGSVWCWRVSTKEGWRRTLRYSTGHWARKNPGWSVKYPKAEDVAEKITSQKRGLSRQLRSFGMEKFDLVFRSLGTNKNLTSPVHLCRALPFLPVS